MIYDTDIMIWVFRGTPAALDAIADDQDRQFSVVTYMELLQGARDRTESRDIKDFLTRFGFRLLPLNENIGHRAAVYIDAYALKARLDLADALVAATAVENNLTLCTAKRKHFSDIAELDLKVFRP